MPSDGFTGMPQMAQIVFTEVPVGLLTGAGVGVDADVSAVGALTGAAVVTVERCMAVRMTTARTTPTAKVTRKMESWRNILNPALGKLQGNRRGAEAAEIAGESGYGIVTLWVSGTRNYNVF